MAPMTIALSILNTVFYQTRLIPVKIETTDRLINIMPVSINKKTLAPAVEPGLEVLIGVVDMDNSIIL